VYVQKGAYDKFARIVTEKTQKLKIGHGSKPGTTIGPLTTPAGVEKTESQVEDAVKHGGLILTGGRRPADLNGYFFEPTVIGRANGEMLVAHEETFGPICALFPFDTEEEAVKAANDTSVRTARPLGVRSFY
jgi:acyl-CoA reductase-like NAD-dependent aldehyde dehydrogenase